MKLIILTVLLTTVIVSCGSNDAGNPAALTTTEDSSEKVYFPVQEFLRGEISYVDSLPVGIMKYTTTGKHMDSGYIQPPEFRALAYEFLSPDLEEELFRENFDETSFYDQGTRYSTFNYTPKTGNTEISRVDVIAAPGLQYDKVNSIYIEKKGSGEPGELRKLYWKAGRHFQIIREDSTGTQTVIKVVWNYWD